MQVRATTRRKHVSQGGRTEVPLPAELQQAVDQQLARPQLAAPPAAADKASDAAGAAGAVLSGEVGEWCSQRYREQLTSFLNSQVRSNVWGV